ncbi:hypothetical protein RUM44_002868 [Polyplax serrata]|uniref:Uncharacterized protein n=1 Tax=Polyplax serrata TaxID=468196 RepID=A0ABR1AYF8_POLSC
MRAASASITCGAFIFKSKTQSELDISGYAYMKPRSNALRIAKLAAFTVIVSSIILGGFILAASWIQANTARNLDLTLNQKITKPKRRRTQENFPFLIRREATAPFNA